jgi:hypothetical protein
MLHPEHECPVWVDSVEKLSFVSDPEIDEEFCLALCAMKNAD